MPKDTDHLAAKGILNSRKRTDETLSFLESVDEFDIKAVHEAVVRARKFARKLADALFEADVALQLRAKTGPPAGPLFEAQAAEDHAKAVNEITGRLADPGDEEGGSDDEDSAGEAAFEAGAPEGADAAPPAKKAARRKSRAKR